MWGSVDLGLSVKWATMNVGATSETDYGLYFQWGDTQGYTAAQVGSGEGQKYFGWDDYKYGTDSNLTKYNATDGLTTLELSDDAAYAASNGQYRMPTLTEFKELVSGTINGFLSNGTLTIFEWSGDDIFYDANPTESIINLSETKMNDSSFTGFVFFKPNISDYISAINNNEYVFLPLTGDCFEGVVGNVNNRAFYLSSSLDIEFNESAYCFDFQSILAWLPSGTRSSGYSVRAVLNQ